MSTHAEYVKDTVHPSLTDFNQNIMPSSLWSIDAFQSLNGHDRLGRAGQGRAACSLWILHPKWAMSACLKQNGGGTKELFSACELVSHSHHLLSKLCQSQLGLPG